VNFTIDFDRKFGFDAIEVKNVRSDSVLAAQNRATFMLTF